MHGWNYLNPLKQWGLSLQNGLRLVSTPTRRISLFRCSWSHWTRIFVLVSSLLRTLSKKCLENGIDLVQFHSHLPCWRRMKNVGSFFFFFFFLSVDRLYQNVYIGIQINMRWLLKHTICGGLHQSSLGKDNATKNKLARERGISVVCSYFWHYPFSTMYSKYLVGHIIFHVLLILFLSFFVLCFVTIRSRVFLPRIITYVVFIKIKFD